MKLAKADWSFHEIPEAELQAAWIWEIQREAGSKQAPWLRLSKAARAECVAYLEGSPALQPVDLSRVDESFVETRQDAYVGTPLALCMFQIDWSAGRKRLLESFDAWLDACRPKEQPAWEPWKNKGGRRAQWKAYLVDLALYRASERKMRSWEAETLFKPLAVWSEIAATSANKFSANHWRDAIRKTEARIAEAQRYPAAWLCKTVFPVKPGS